MARTSSSWNRQARSELKSKSILFRVASNLDSMTPKGAMFPPSLGSVLRTPKKLFHFFFQILFIEYIKYMFDKQGCKCSWWLSKVIVYKNKSGFLYSLLTGNETVISETGIWLIHHWLIDLIDSPYISVYILKGELRINVMKVLIHISRVT